MTSMTGPRVRGLQLWVTVIAAYFVALAIMVASAYVWVYLYSVFVYAGGDAAYYEAYAQTAGPVVAVVVASPVFYAVGRFMCRFGERALFASLAVVFVNVLMDGLILLTISEHMTHHLLMSTFATLGKCAGAWAGVQGGR